MKFDPDSHHRRSIRLKGYDYTQAGAYFVTICTQDRAPLFGDVVASRMLLNDAGRVAETCWRAIPDHFPRATLDTCVVLPNHVHGVIIITDHPPVGAKDFSPLRLPQPGVAPFQSPSRTVGSIVRGFKIGVTKWFRATTDIHEVWQRNYYEHVIRDDDELARIRQYILDNPARWHEDDLNPEAA